MALSRVDYRSLLLSTILASGMAFIDGTALNVALPELQRDLSLNAAQLLWVVNAYVLPLSALLLLGGSLGDKYGRKKVFIYGILVFMTASMLCGLSVNGPMLIAFRALQGLGGALMVPGSLSLITALTSPERKGTAIGTWSMFSAMTTILGPVIGGLFADAGLWRFIFFINLPLALIALVTLYRHVPESRDEYAPHPDIPGLILGTISLAFLTYGFTEASRLGYGVPYVRFSIITGIVLIMIFFIVGHKSKNPLLPPQLLRNRRFVTGNMATLFIYTALGALMFFFPLNLIQIQQYPASIAGLALLPFGLLIAFFSGISGRWADKIGPRTPLIFGQLLTAISYFMFSIPGQTSGPEEFWTSFFMPVVIFGVGMGLTVAPLTTLVMNSVETKNTGIASGVNNTIARSAQVLAVAIIGSFAILSFEQQMKLGLSDIFTPIELSDISKQIKKLGDAQPPDYLDTISSQTFETAKNQAFIYIFRQVALISCILTGFSTCLTYFFVPRR